MTSTALANLTDDNAHHDQSVRDPLRSKAVEIDYANRSYITAGPNITGPKVIHGQLATFTHWQRYLEDLRKAIRRYSCAVAAKGALRELIDRIEVFAVGHPCVYALTNPEPILLRPAGWPTGATRDHIGEVCR